MFEIIAPALAIGTLLAILAGPLGSLVVWGRMSYFGDTLSHAAVLGISLGFLLNVHPMTGVFIITLLVAMLLGFGQRQQSLANDTLLGIISHGTLATGLVIASQLEHVRIDLMGILFGDLLSTSFTEVIWIGTCSVAIGLLLWLLWRPLLNSIINAELAQAEGIPVNKIRTLLMIMLAFLVAVGMKVVGALLITAMLIIPAASARKLSQTPEQMAIIASLFGVLSVWGGLFASAQWDTPAGPSIVLCACMIFSLGSLTSTWIRLRISKDQIHESKGI